MANINKDTCPVCGAAKGQQCQEYIPNENGRNLWAVFCRRTHRSGTQKRGHVVT